MPQSAFTPEALAARLEALLVLPQSLTKAAAAARAWGTVDAAERLADLVLAELPGMARLDSAADRRSPEADPPAQAPLRRTREAV